MKLYTNNIQEYLSASDIVDYGNSGISILARQLKYNCESEVDLIKKIYEYVRDSIQHSADINGHKVTCKASDVLEYGEGICYAKSHLLAALLRYHQIPCGFCYQKLILDEKNAPYIIIHGLNAVYIKSLNKWMRIDARGNKENVDAQFLVDKEKLAFTIHQELGEEDIMVIYPEPDLNIVNCLENSKTVAELMKNLPRELQI